MRALVANRSSDSGVSAKEAPEPQVGPDRQVTGKAVLTTA
jgi:hypothetical protein